MNHLPIHLTSQPIGKGRERTCYLHPEDPSKIIKISGEVTSIQSEREMNFYRKLLKRRNFQYTHLPRFHGITETNLGQGLVVDLICDYDHSVSRSLLWYLDQGTPVSEIEFYLDELKQYFLQNLLIFNHDMVPGNLLFQKTSPDSKKLVMIDGMGDVVFLEWLNNIPHHARSKINRRWERFLKRLLNCKEVTRHLQNAP